MRVALVVPCKVRSSLAAVPPLIAAMVGVVMVGEDEKTKLPVPVSSVTAASKFALLGVAKNVATFVASVTKAALPSVPPTPMLSVRVAPAALLKIMGLVLANDTDPVLVSIYPFSPVLMYPLGLVLMYPPVPVYMYPFVPVYMYPPSPAPRELSLLVVILPPVWVSIYPPSPMLMYPFVAVVVIFPPALIVLPSAIVNVAPVAGWVIVTLLILLTDSNAVPSLVVALVTELLATAIAPNKSV